MGVVIAVVNQKGGVGKTTTAVNLATTLSLRRKRVLLVDFDPQGNATTGIGIEKEILKFTVYDSLINNFSLRDLIIPTPVSPLYIVPANLDLAGAEIELANSPQRENVLRDKLKEIKGEFDYILIDCPPSLGLLTLNALVSAELLIIPVQCEYYAMEGLVQLFEIIREVRASLNPQLKILGILLTMADNRTNLTHQVISEIRRHFPRETLKTVIPRNIRISESPSYGKPVVLYSPRCNGAKSYYKLTKEVMKRVQKGIR
ncbi:ParA family protein [Candidatus Calescamantes bacterium]|nr:ParA family protein [Candidatus Calescamantes bacterium]